MSDNVKISLAFAVSLIVMILAVGRWQGGVDTSITMMFEKIVTNKADIKDLDNRVGVLDSRVDALAVEGAKCPR